MPLEYSAENHDWDLTLLAAYELLQLGKAMDQKKRTGSMSMGFSALTGSMLLSFSAIESFSASVAFAMPQSDRFADFDFSAYQSERAFWGRLELLCNAFGHDLDRSQGLFQLIKRMQIWRNLVSHASPYRLEKIEIENTMAVGNLHQPKRNKEYTRSVDVETASKFYRTSYDFIDFLKSHSGLDPKTYAAYKTGV